MEERVVPFAEVKAVLDDPPPISINRAYSVGPHGRLFLTSAGRSFKDALTQRIATSSHDWKSFYEAVYQHGGWLELDISLYFDDLENGSWKPESKTPKGKLKSPYKRKDGSNYIKLIEDAVSNATGIDDANHLAVSVRKSADAERPRIELTLKAYASERSHDV